MKTSFLLAAAGLLAPVLGAAVASNRDQINQYKNIDDCHGFRDPLPYGDYLPGRCYDIDERAGAFYFPGRYDPYVYYDRGCRGERYDPFRAGECYERGSYGSFRYDG